MNSIFCKYKQVLPGSGQGISLSFVHLQEKTFLAFPCVGKKVTIVDESLKVIQVLVLEDEVIYVDWAQPTGKLAVSSNKKIVIFEPDTTATTWKWKRLGEIIHDFTVSCFSWKPGGSQLLVSGSNLFVLWKIETVPPPKDSDEHKPILKSTQIWKTELANSVIFCTFSPLGNYFASFGNYDSYVKVWYKYNRAGMRRFLYLPHERAVLNIAWRVPSITSVGIRNNVEPNVLVTLSQDHVVRVWQESCSKERLTFGVCAVIEPKQECMIGWLSNPLEIFFEPNDSTSRQLHVLERQGLRHSLLPSTSDVSIDWIVTIQKDGTAILWKLKGLSNQPRSTVSSSLFFKFNVNSRWEFPATLVALSNHTGTMNPSNLRFYALDTSGSVSLWKVENSSPFKTIASLSATCSGHLTQISSIISHPNNNLVASIDQSKRLVIWNYSPPTFLDTPFTLSDISTMEKCHHLAWITSAPSNFWFVISTESKGAIYCLSQNTAQEVVPLLESEISAPFSFLASFSGKEKFEAFIVGISNSGTQISCWSVKWSEIENAPSVSKIATASVNEDQQILCASIRSPNFTFGLDSLLLTGGKDGCVRLWVLDSLANQLKQRNNIQLYSCPIYSLSCGTFGFFATRSETNIDIWQLEDLDKLSLLSQIPLVPETSKSNNNNSSFISFDWLPLQEGNSVLVIGQGKDIKVVYRGDEKLRSGKVTWEVSPFQSLISPISTIAWTPDGSIICGASNELFVFTKWLSDEAEYPTNLRWFISKMQALPFYHPKFLVDYLLAGKTHKVGSILHQLVKFIESSNGKKDSLEVPLLSLEKFFQDGDTEVDTKPKQEEEDSYSFLNTPLSSSPDEKTKFSSKPNPLDVFPPSEAQNLSSLLTSFVLPNVSAQEQSLLLAIIDTFTKVQATDGGIDDCGMRYLLSYKLFSFLQRVLPPSDRPTSLTSSDFAWALHSESQQDLIHMCLPVNATWATAKPLGLGLWLRNPIFLKEVIEKLAKAQFTENKDPHDCFLFYLALNKKDALVALFQAVKNTKVYDFVKQDFSIPKNQTSALKNAYTLMSKHRFELAAAFFLLGGQLKDCVNICLQKLGDYQLALIVARLVEGEDSPIYKSVLKEYVLPKAQEQHDKFLANIALWLMKDYSESVKTLLPEESNYQKVNEFNPSSIHFFNFLRSHTMLRNTTLDLDEIYQIIATKSARWYYHSRLSLSAFEQTKMLLQKLAQTNKPAPVASTPSFGLSGMGKFFPGRKIVPQVQEKKQIDKTLLFLIALNIFGNEISNIETTLVKNIKESPQLLNQNLKYLATTLQISEDSLRKEVWKFCEQNEHFGAQFLLLWGNKSQQETLIKNKVDQLLTICQRDQFPEVTLMQSAQLFRIIKQLYYCVQSIEGGLSDHLIRQFNFITQIILFIHFWIEKKYVKLCQFFSGEKQVIQLIQMSSNEGDKLNELDSSFELEGESDVITDKPVQLYLLELFRFLCLKRIYLLLEKNPQLNIKKTDIPKYLQYLNRWVEDSCSALKTLPVAIENQLSLVSLDYHLFLKFYRAWDKFKEDAPFRFLIDYLLSDETLRLAIVNLPIKHTKSQVNNIGTSAEILISEILYKDNDILQSFCINAVDSSFMAMATTRGIREIQINYQHRLEQEDEEDTQGEHNDDTASEHSTESPSLFKRKTSSIDGGKSIFGKHKKIPLSYEIVNETLHHTVVQCLSSHPLQPYYLGGGIDGGITLWQFNAPKESTMLNTYRVSANHSSRINKIHFNSGGTKFGGCDMSGDLAIWRFGANEGITDPFKTFHCHSKRTLDFAFLNSGSVIATAGISSDQRNICIWDTLLPNHRSLVTSFLCHESGASSLAYSPKHQLLISGGKKGDIVVFDIRQQKELERMKAHTMNVKSLALDPMEKFIISGSNEGNVRVWELPTFTCKYSWDDVHVKQRFVRAPGINPGVFTDAISTFGVMQVRVSKDYIYSCGSDGRLLRMPFQYS